MKHNLLPDQEVGCVLIIERCLEFRRGQLSVRGARAAVHRALGGVVIEAGIRLSRACVCRPVAMMHAGTTAAELLGLAKKGCRRQQEREQRYDD